ncbi:UDP-N-acetylmuramoyl-L-alanyl-D-glutamate--2,6-diaminopimelate ligase [Pararhodospirillum oryzae]|uniref:UDP-N-acetylmuramoyl-L-alanyl-D-glutamate--2,6-diaminopimelate ligase n=1 Tax=Pararhodospirillum oryzae TaxID=478448 RepID=A0A512H8P2_9PROT|nr:UDP-N-acetylmuramoyl-L-alanyl-D-glutamate--2,6-diaminopimelate ligase [Pararhodospirillum oryzae]GEO81819.1 UDP-N-acetylmuramoyl-L-alanyl-D-glutamate--2,6-diaminopimelate ligase [Pararhodospirillum oryzae]
MRLADIGTLLGLPPVSSDRASLAVAGLSADSRAIKPGWLFAALPGTQVDGRAFVPQALAAGAIAVLAPPGTDLPPGADAWLFAHPEPRRALARLAGAFFAPQPAPVVAVTGTNGKTSTVTFAAALWRALGRPGATSVGTLGVHGAGLDRPGRLTTPDPVALHAALADIARAGGGPVALEASSHGLEQDRLAGLVVQAAALTNITRDHLDHHGSMEAYRAAKTRLFSDVLVAGGTAVLNADIPETSAIEAVCRDRSLRVFRYGENGAEIRLRTRTPTAHGQVLALEVLGHDATVTLPLAGAFQAMNALAALGLVLGCEDRPEDMVVRAVNALETLSGVPGRLENVARRANGAAVYVDYAHTPDALETVLRALRPHATGRLVCVFGCGGDRDTGKRPLMGRLAATLADRVIVTDDNPRSEDPAAIRAQILAACPGATEIGDRAQAIRVAVADLAAGDLLVIAGKGHETGQTVAGVTHPFCDRTHAQDAVAEADT